MQGDNKIKFFISEYDASTYICYENDQIKYKSVLLQALIKYNISTGKTEPYHHKQNISKTLIQVKKNVANDILDLTVGNIYMWIYYLLPWVWTTNSLY